MGQIRETSSGRIETPDLVEVEVAYEVRRKVSVWAFSSAEAKAAAKAGPSEWADAGEIHECIGTVRVPRDRVLGGES